MKTLKLTAAESRAYSAGERRFWRAMKPQPEEIEPGVWNWNGRGRGCFISTTFTLQTIGRREEILPFCPYGTPGDDIRLAAPNPPFLDTITQPVITAITVTQLAGKWGWLVEVGA